MLCLRSMERTRSLWMRTHRTLQVWGSRDFFLRNSFLQICCQTSHLNSFCSLLLSLPSLFQTMWRARAWYNKSKKSSRCHTDHWVTPSKILNSSFVTSLNWTPPLRSILDGGQSMLFGRGMGDGPRLGMKVGRGREGEREEREMRGG